MQRQAYFEQFEFQAESRPQAVAVETAGRSISYETLNRQANRIAHSLAAHGVMGGVTGGANGIVGLFLDPGIDFVAALLGTGKAGAAFLPLPPDLPERRLAAYLDKARCRVIVTDAANRPALETLLAAAGAEAVILEADGPAGERPGHNPGIAVGPGDGCYVMFTSGSTGQPKAILGQQRGLSHFLRWELAEFGLGAETRGSWLAPITFDVSLRDILVPLMAGGTVCVPAPELRGQPRRLVDWMADSRLTLVHCVPTVLRLLVRELEHRAPAQAPFPDLRHLLVAGEPLPGADVAAWRAVAGTRAELVNLYGPSETTLAKLFYRVGDLSGDPRRVLPIGRPLPNTAVLILNQGRACAAGEIGEIHIRTPYRSLGYLGDPELTAAAFIQNPLSPDKPDVIYRTGDLGRLLPDGTVECLGRQDNQVKINGIRIELAEIEAALRQVPGVTQAACAVHTGADQRPLLAGYYVRADGSAEPLPVDAVKAALDRILPTGMQPHVLIALPALPTTISGKLNRKALPRPEALYYQESGYVPAETATEKALAAVWNGLFGIAGAGVTTRFHTFGGDSLRAIRAVLEIYQTCGVEVALKDFFANSTIRELAALIDRARTGSPSASAPRPIPRVPDAPSHPASPAQARLWRLDRMGIAPTAYNLPEAYELRGPVDAAALEQAFRTLIRRHESLRTSFREEDGQARQVVHADLRWRLETIDLRRHARPEEEAHRLAAGNREHVFDLESGPLLHAVLARLPDDTGDGDGTPRHVFLFNIHHIVSDVWSLGVLVRELAAAYAALTHGRSPDLPLLALQQRDATAWQAGRLADGALEADRRYWLDRLGGPLPVLELPADRPRPPVQTFNGTTHRLRLPAEATGRLLGLAEAHGATLFAALTALTKALLHRHSGQRDIIVGSPVAGRDHPGLDGQIGYLVNTLALRDRVEPETPFAELLAAVGRTAADGVAHQSYPFDRLVGELDLARDMSRSPVFDVMVVVQTFEAIDLALEGASARPFGPENAWNFSRYDLVFHFQTDGGELVLDLNYNRDLFDASRITALCGHFAVLAEGAALAPHTPVGTLPLLSGPERAAIAGFAAGLPADRPPLSMAALLSEVAARHPGRPALVDAARSLDHAGLEAAAGQLARLLVAHGVEARDRVAVLANRSVESVIALLAILKAGAVYVPLDPDYPATRLAAMLERAECRLVLVDRPGDESALPPGGPATLAVAPLLDPGAAVPDHPLPAVAPDEVAYIIFTSGSTGQPKAVMVEHAGFVNMALGQIEAFGLGAGDRVLQFASPSFDASLANLFMALFAGGAVVLPDKAVIESVPRFLEFLAASGTTVATLPPTYLRALERAALPTLTVLITAGEAAPVADLTHYAGGLRAFNAYGPTEASVCATVHRVTDADAALARIPIGRPLPNTSLHILDGAGQAVPVGVPGEVHLGGAGLARGYRGDAAQTAARFVTAAWGERLYRTGDLACWRHDGTVDFLGRADEQVKVSGHRIELGEVEQALRSVPGVRDAAVAAVARTDGSQALAAYYCLEARVELWPSVAEFFVYDDVAYSSMAGDEGRNRRYRDAFARHLPGRTVVDIGTGPFAILARLALEAGARKVYAIDLLESTARKARETVARLGLSDRIEVIHGDALSIALPEPVDFCISEIVGAIGGSEGAAKIINGARRFLTDPTRMLPQRSLTRIAAVGLPEGSFAYGFPDIAAHYVERIFAEVGRPFDLRICVKNLPREAILSTAGIFEDLDHTGIVPLESVHDGELVVERDGPVTGLLVWLQLHVDGDHVVDILDNPGSWLPVYLPLDQAGIAVRPGDRVRFTVARSLCGNGLNPDFTVTGRIERQDAEAVPFRVISAHFGDGFRASPFHERLFAAGPVPRADAVTPVAVRRYLSRLLPAHAVPAHLVALDSLPVTVNGKVDRAALPAPTAPAAVRRRDPATPVEQVVLEVWRAVLERGDISVDDDFFGLGGDSIRAIQIVSRLRGLELGAEIRDIFQNPSVARFALVVKPLKPRADQGPVTGPVPLAPIQRWFFETVDEDHHHFNQGVLLRATAGFDAGALRTALDSLWRHHDALRTVFPAAADGASPPDAVILPPEGGPSLTLIELGAEPGVDEDAALTAAADRLHAGFRLESGPLFAALLARGASCDRLLLAAHHLVVDSVSWSVLLEDVQTAYAAALAGTVPALPDKTASHRDYAGALAALAGGGWSGALAYWKTVTPPEPLAILPPGRKAVRMADMANVSGRLDRDTTALLLGPAHRAYGTRTDDLLLAGLALALRRRLNRRRTLVTLESHGREWPAGIGTDAAPPPDLTRTVGWFTAHYPFLLDSGTDGSGNDDIGALVKRVKESLRQVPDRGWSYGLLTRHPAGPGLAPLAGQIGFNFLGVMAGGRPDGGFTIDWDAPGQALGPRVRRPHPLDILAMVVDGTLTVGLDYDAAVGRETAKGLLDGFLDSLAGIARHCASRSGSEATPSDFTYKGLSLDELDTLLHAD